MTSGAIRGSVEVVMTPRRSLVPSLVLAAALLAACGDDDDEAVAGDAATEHVVTIEQSRFAPESVAVAAGAGVTFENLDPYAHTVTSDAFDSGQLGEGETFETTFDEAGTYEYFCEVHPTMRGEVVVS